MKKQRISNASSQKFKAAFPRIRNKLWLKLSVLAIIGIIVAALLLRQKRELIIDIGDGNQATYTGEIVHDIPLASFNNQSQGREQ